VKVGVWSRGELPITEGSSSRFFSSETRTVGFLKFKESLPLEDMVMRLGRGEGSKDELLCESEMMLSCTFRLRIIASFFEFSGLWGIK